MGWLKNDTKTLFSAPVAFELSCLSSLWQCCQCQGTCFKIRLCQFKWRWVPDSDHVRRCTGLRKNSQPRTTPCSRVDANEDGTYTLCNNFTHSCHAWHTPGLKSLTKRGQKGTSSSSNSSPRPTLHPSSLPSLPITIAIVFSSLKHPFSNFWCTSSTSSALSKISSSMIVSKRSVFSILSILKCNVVSGCGITRFPRKTLVIFSS